jgi:hypothetical protein
LQTLYVIVTHIHKLDTTFNNVATAILTNKRSDQPPPNIVLDNLTGSGVQMFLKQGEATLVAGMMKSDTSSKKGIQRTN